MCIASPPFIQKYTSLAEFCQREYAGQARLARKAGITFFNADGHRYEKKG
jgi:hypothetical protein